MFLKSPMLIVKGAKLENTYVQVKNATFQYVLEPNTTRCAVKVSSPLWSIPRWKVTDTPFMVGRYMQPHIAEYRAGILDRRTQI